MKQYFCPLQEQVTSAVRSGILPEGFDPALRAHVESCEICHDIVLVAQVLRQSRAEMLPTPQLQSPGLLWWRAQLRRRNAAMERVARPIAIAETVALFIVLLAVAGFGLWQHTQVVEWLSSVWTPLTVISQMPGLLFASLGTVLLFGGLAVYLIAAKE
jgi:hypothetical protein